MGVSNAWALNSTFTKGEVLFIYTDNGDAAWTSSACVKLWFNYNDTGKGLAGTQWLSDYDGNHKLFYAIVPGDGANKVQLQRFANDCSTWWNACGDALQSSRQKDAYNTFYSNGSSNNNFGWKNETFEMYLYGAPNNWASSLGTFVHQGNGDYKYTYRYKTTASSLEFKLVDSKGKWHGDNVSATELTIGKTYDLTGTVNLANGMTLTMEKSVVSFPVTFSPKGTFGSSKVTAQINSTPLTSGTNYESGQKIVFTASPASGYEIVGWYSDASCTSSLNNEKNTTYTITSLDDEVQVYVKFKETTHSVQVQSADNNQGTVNPTSVNAGQFTGVTITATPKIGYSFANWIATDGIIIANANSASTTITATKKGTVTANFEAQPATTIYLEPTGHWNSHNPQFVAHVWNNISGDHKDIIMTGVGDSPYRYYKAEVPYGCTNVVFYRKSTDGNTLWNKTNDLEIPKNDKVLYTITSAGKGQEESYNPAATGDWKAANLVYTLTLNSCAIGTYSFKYNGKTYFSKANENVTVNIPAGAEIQIPAGQPHNDRYEGRVIKVSPIKEQLTTDQIITVNGNITLDDNFVTKNAHVVYLGVPDDLNSWTSGSYSNFIWHWNTMESLGLIASTSNVKIDNTTYYEYTIPAGSHTFCFQRKTDVNDNENPQTESVYFPFQIPSTEVNCFTLKNEKDNEGRYKGTWGILPAQEGDYRLLYVEQTVRKSNVLGDEWKTVVARDYEHNSDIVRKHTTEGIYQDIVSLHVRRMKNDNTDHNPEVILQRYEGGNWVDIKAHMVNGPLKAEAGMAMINGRRNAGTNSDIDDFVDDDGIEVIKNDTEKGRVWNFKIQQTVDAKGIVTATLLLDEENLKPYEGRYYIRTDNADGGWVCYNHTGNVMSHSEYSLQHSGYSHYFCKWVALNGKLNVKFVVANDYCAAISDPIASDIYTDENGTLKEAAANVRWMWNEYTNIGSRAYIAGSNVDNFLVAKYAESSTKTFEDKGDWVYEADLTDVHINDKLTSIAAKYGEKLLEELLEKSHVDAGGLVMLASAGNNAGESSYTVRIMYDFKINQTICYLIPTGTAVATSIDVLIERTNQDEEGNATQVTAAITPANSEVGLTVYGLITLTKDHITDPSKSEQEALTYWISFPFDVKIGDITGFGKVGQHWMIKYYDGAERAAKGWFLDTKTFWKFFLNTDDVMKANTGYVLTLNKSLLNASNPVYDNTTTLRLYFPSKEKIKGVINDGLTKTTVDVPAHWCNITSPADRTIKDSHWNMIGVPSYANKTITTTNETIKYFYDYSHQDDKYNTTQNAGAKTFKPMHAYMVQFAGVIDWHNQAFNEAQQQLAAKKNTDAEEQYTLRLELQQNGAKADQTFVELHDDATTMFDMNVDLTKMFNASSANIYTLIGSDNQVAANVMPIANTTIPVGVQIATAGEYTFAMPDGTDGITVELIDYETNTRTNLLLSDYTVNLPAGTCETRFALSVKIDKTATSVENITEVEGANSEDVKKYIIDGKLFLQKDHTLYDAQGHIVR